MNLVGLKGGGRIVEGLLYDAFFIRSRLPGAGSLLDLGSGSGVVAIPLAVLDPGRDIYSVDKTFKKVLFQRHIKRLLGLKGLQVVHGRAEDISPLFTDLLVAKAFGLQPGPIRCEAPCWGRQGLPRPGQGRKTYRSRGFYVGEGRDIQLTGP